MNKYYGKTAQIQTEIRADREEFIEFLGTDPDNQTLEFVGLSLSTWKKITTGKRPTVPISAWRLARFKRHAHLSDILGPEWREFVASGSQLTIPGFRYPIPATDLRSLCAEKQKALNLERLYANAESLLKMYRCLFSQPAIQLQQVQHVQRGTPALVE